MGKPNCSTCAKCDACELSSLDCEGYEYVPRSESEERAPDSDWSEQPKHEPSNEYVGNCVYCGKTITADEFGVCDACLEADNEKNNKRYKRYQEDYNHANMLQPKGRQLFSLRVWESAVERRLSVQIVWFGKRYKVTLSK